ERPDRNGGVADLPRASTAQAAAGIVMEDEQDLVDSALLSVSPPGVRGGFLARVNARIDATSEWLGLTDFRLWTLRLAPAACALALLAVFWQGPGGAAFPATPSRARLAA